ncbi:MAG: AAA family ATPase [Solirubrobacteraceae bacterium]|nr:AAA family ATPase [Solirubrobacteraceae bacterium]
MPMATVHLHLHVRALPGGRFVVTPVPFCDLSEDGAAVEDLKSAVIANVEERLGDMTGSPRAALMMPSQATLDAVEVKVGKDRGGVALTIGLVVVERATASGARFLVYAPEVPQLVLAVAAREAAREAARAKLPELLAHWPPDTLLAADEAGEVRLEALELPLDQESGGGGSFIERTGDDLTARAAAGTIGRLDRRDPLVERVLAALSADGRASVMLVGPSDVGKSAMTNEIAARLAADEVPPALSGLRLIRISANELIAGAQYTGQWQERARRLVRFGRDTGAIVAMGDPLGIVDAGRWSQSDNNLSRVLRTYVEQGELRLICEATSESLGATRKLEPSFADAFHRVDVPEPDVEAAHEILAAAARRLEVNHDVRLHDEALQAALELTRRFEPYRALPGKAVRVLEEATQVAADGADRALGREAVTRAFARRTGLPLAMLSDEIALRTSDARAFFEERVLGQPEAVEAMVDLVAVVKAGLNDGSKPLGTFFFVGPTGVGKTELSKSLAEYLFGSRERLLRFDMGEYSAGDALARLTGSAWQRGDEGELTRRVREQPFCVILLDEIEKAHRDVFDVLLSALGEARLTDASGRLADLRNAIVIMTSNLGATRSGSAGVGFVDAPAGEERAALRRHYVEQAERFFRPEFFNRIDHVLAFDALDEATIRRIARREVGRLLMREGITRRRLLVEIDDAVVERLAAQGFHPRYGARPLQREIERAVIRPLARLIVEQRPGPGDLVRLSAAGAQGEIALEVHRVREPRPARRAAAGGVDGAAGPAQATLGRVATQVRRLMERIDAEAAGPVPSAVGQELSRLLDESNAPGFWDDQETARHTLTRVYQLQRAVDGLRAVRGRAEGLVELAGQMRSRRDPGRLAELRRALTECEEQLALSRLELAGAAAGPDEPDAVLTFTAVGGEAVPWADELLAMYGTWAQRTGREATRPAGATGTLVVSGPASYALLTTEAGLHRRDGPDRGRRLVRVSVSLPGEPHAADGPDPGAVVRIYQDGTRSGVRDPRTGVRVGNVGAVLREGRIDEFLLAAVRLVRAGTGAEPGGSAG